MRVRDIINQINELKPSANIYSPSVKMDWINHVEGAAWNEIYKHQNFIDVPRVQGQAVYNLPSGVSFDRVTSVFLEGEPVFKTDYKSFETTGFYRVSNTQIGIYPVPSENDLTPRLRISYYEPYARLGDVDSELSIPAPYDRVYWQYVSAMIDWFNKEFENYSASIALYNASFKEFSEWWNNRE